MLVTDITILSLQGTVLSVTRMSLDEFVLFCQSEIFSYREGFLNYKSVDFFHDPCPPLLTHTLTGIAKVHTLIFFYFTLVFFIVRKNLSICICATILQNHALLKIDHSQIWYCKRISHYPIFSFPCLWDPGDGD